MANNNKIAFFDSGVGLFSILFETKKLLPKENFVIYADQIHNPYGEKTQIQVKKFTKDATNLLIKKHRIKMMVLACNTASVLALSHLRKRFQIPFVGVVPAIKPAIAKTKNHKIAIMSTPATAKSAYLNKLIKLHCSKEKILKVGCSGLEEAIEVLDYHKINLLIKKFSKKIKEFGADTVVLGCTHYPLIKAEIKKQLGSKIQIIDSGKAVARRIKNLLYEKNALSSKKESNFYYTSANPSSFSKVASAILRNKINAQKIIIR